MLYYYCEKLEFKPHMSHRLMAFLVKNETDTKRYDQNL